MDSLCIDQTNLDEKGKQVQLMGDIYEAAQEVLACVEEHAVDSELVIDVLQSVNVSSYMDRVGSKTTAEGQSEHPDSVVKNLPYILDSALQRFPSILQEQWQKCPVDQLSLAEFHRHFNRAVLSFCNRKYWTRIWIVQEVVLAKRVKLLCGSSQLNVANIAPFFTEAMIMNTVGREWTEHWESSKMSAVIELSHHTGRWTSEQGVELTAGFAFENLRDSECFDFRDRVYGLLQVLRWGLEKCDIKIRPDYQITKLGLLVQVARDIVPHNLPGAWIWGVMYPLHEAFRLTVMDGEISRLIQQRKSSVDERDNRLINTKVLRSKTLTVDWPAAWGFLLASEGGDLTLRGHYRLYTGKNQFQDALAVLELQKLKLKAGDQTIGWVCPKAIPGDYLVVSMAVTDSPVTTPYFVVRQIKTPESSKFQIVGHAVLFKYPKDQSEMPRIVLRFDIEDYIALIAMRHDMDKDGTTAEDLIEFLHMSPVREMFSSHATECDT